MEGHRRVLRLGSRVVVVLCRARLARALGPVLLALGLACVAVAPAAAATSATFPLRVDTTISLSEQYGYAPAYELNVPTFDPGNVPFIRSRTVSQHLTGHVHTLVGASWTKLALVAAVRRDYPKFAATVNAGGYVSETVEFDRQGRAYTLLDIRLSDGSRQNVLLYSLDGCRTWRTLTLPFGGRRTVFDGRDGGTATMEHFTGWNLNDGPPLVAVWRPVEDWPGEFASRNELYVLRPVFEGDRLMLPAPKLVTRRALAYIQCAGGASFAATSGDRSFIVWAEVARPDASSTPTYAADFDPVDGVLGPRVLVGKAVPANDSHDTPGICLDGAGFLHVVTGAHGRPFFHTQSLHSLDATAWTAPKAVLTSGYVDATTDHDGAGKQTYLSLVCLPNDTLVIAFRQTRAGVDDVFAGKRYMPLCVQRRPRGGEWSAPKRLVFPRRYREYTIYHHKLAVDRLGRLFLSLSLFDPKDYPVDQRARNRYRHRMVLFSGDGGVTWGFATDRDYATGVIGPG